MSYLRKQMKKVFMEIMFGENEDNGYRKMRELAKSVRKRTRRAMTV